MDEMSIGFIAVQQSWSPDYMERRITEINLNRGDVSVVCWAANPAANGASMTALPVSQSAARPPVPGREVRAEETAAAAETESTDEVESIEEEAAEVEVEQAAEEPEEVATEEHVALARLRVRILALRR